MTWSLLARDDSGNLAVAVASRFFAVGALCPYGRSAVGVVATQALVNPHLGPLALELLGQGDDPQTVVKALIESDDGAAHRQVHVLSADGRSAAHTGDHCIGWCGAIAGAGVSVAGNMLVGPEVLDATLEAFTTTSGPLSLRMIAAMQAGEAVGGDKRGRQAAALRIYSTEEYAALDLRVDDHVDPLGELRRLHDKSLERWQPFLRCLPRKDDRVGMTDRARIEEEIQRFHANRI